MEEQDIYIVDTRNATTDHRTGGGGSSSGWRPSRPVQAIPATGTRVYGPAPMAQPQILYATPPQYATPQTGIGASLLGRITAGQLVELVAQVFAALMPLPAAPVATENVVTDVGNSMLYQNALASHAKRDEQIRTLGNLVTKLLG